MHTLAYISDLAIDRQRHVEDDLRATLQPVLVSNLAFQIPPTQVLHEANACRRELRRVEIEREARTIIADLQGGHVVVDPKGHLYIPLSMLEGVGDDLVRNERQTRSLTRGKASILQMRLNMSSTGRLFQQWDQLRQDR